MECCWWLLWTVCGLALVTLIWSTASRFSPWYILLFTALISLNAWLALSLSEAALANIHITPQ